MFPKRSEAILRIRQRALMENSLFVKDTEIIAMANRAITVVYKHCLTALGADTYARRMVISGIGADASKPPVIWPNVYKNDVSVPPEVTSFPLWSDFYKLLRCDWVKGTVVAQSSGLGTYWTTPQNTVNWCPMQRLEFRSGVIDDSPREWSTGLVAYWLRANHDGYGGIDVAANASNTWWISFLPPPASAVSVCIWFIPTAPKYFDQDGTDQIRLPDDAWEYVLNTTAAEMLEKQGRDASARRGAAGAALSELLTSNVVPDEQNVQGTIDINASQAPHGRRKNVWGP